MEKKIGRPRISGDSAKDVLIGARFGDEEAKPVEGAVRGAGGNKSEWLRETALKEARRTSWVKSKWAKEDLDGKLVEFKLSFGAYAWVEGVGKFLVRKNPIGKLAIEILVYKYETPGPYPSGEVRYWITQPVADKIETNPNPKRAQFRLLW